MAHPIMFQEDDPLLARVRAIALVLPEAAEKISHGRPAFFTQKVFCYFGGSVRSDDRQGADTDWQEIAELIDASYRVTAPRRLVHELDAR